MEMVEAALLNESERVSIFHRTLAFMREVLGRGQFARPSGVLTQHHYIWRLRPSQPFMRRRARTFSMMSRSWGGGTTIPSCPCTWAWARTSTTCISLFAMISLLILEFGYFKKFNEILKYLDMIYECFFMNMIWTFEMFGYNMYYFVI